MDKNSKEKIIELFKSSKFYNSEFKKDLNVEDIFSLDRYSKQGSEEVLYGKQLEEITKDGESQYSFFYCHTAQAYVNKLFGEYNEETGKDFFVNEFWNSVRCDPKAQEFPKFDDYLKNGLLKGDKFKLDDLHKDAENKLYGLVDKKTIDEEICYLTEDKINHYVKNDDRYRKEGKSAEEVINLEREIDIKHFISKSVLYALAEKATKEALGTTRSEFGKGLSEYVHMFSINHHIEKKDYNPKKYATGYIDSSIKLSKVFEKVCEYLDKDPKKTNGYFGDER